MTRISAEEFFAKSKPTTETSGGMPQSQPVSSTVNQGGFISNIKEAAISRGKDIAGIIGEKKSGIRRNLPLAGAVAGFVGDVTGETAMAGLKAIAPRAVEEQVGAKAQQIFGSQPVQDVVGQYEQIKQQYPEATRAFESVFNIASLLPITGGAKVGGKVVGEGLEAAGKGLISGAEEGLQKQAVEYATKLVSPTKTKAIREAEVARTQVINGKKVVTPDLFEQQAIEEVSKIKGVSPKNTLQQNYNVIRQENTNLAKQLETDVANTNIIIPRKESIARLNAIKETLSQNPVIVGSAEKTAGRLLEGAKKFINQNDGSLSGLLKARKDYDNWVLTQKPKAFDATAENAFTIANREVRQTLNNLLDEKAPNVGIKDSLRKQSSLYSALDNIAPKAAEEASTKIGRAVQRIGNTLGIKNKAVQTLAGLGLVGGGGAAALASLPAVATAGVGYLTYRGGKFLISAKVRKALGELLESGGKKINPSDAKIIQNLIDKAGKANKQGGFAKNPFFKETDVLTEKVAEAIKSIDTDPVKVNGKLEFGNVDDAFELDKAKARINTGKPLTATEAEYYAPILKRNGIDVYKELDNAMGNVETSLINEAKKYKTVDEFIDSLDITKQSKSNSNLSNLSKDIDVDEFGKAIRLAEKEFGIKTNSEAVKSWEKRIKLGEKPVIYVGGDFMRVIDGSNRLQAYKNLKYNKVPTVFQSQLEEIFKKAKKK